MMHRTDALSVFLIIVAVLVGSAFPALAQGAAATPFGGASRATGPTSSSAAAGKEKQEDRTGPSPRAFSDLDKGKGGFLDSVLEWFKQVNRTLNDAVAGYLRRARSGFSFSLVLVVFFVSVVYGWIHSLGPGHGKALVASYFVDHGEGVRDAAKMGGIIAATHTGSSLIIATIFQIVLLAIPDQATQTAIRRWFTIASGAVIIGVGLWALVERVRPAHHTDRGERAVHEGRSLPLVALAAGIVPCPLAMAVMFLSVSFGIYYVGLISVLGMSLGMFLLLFPIGAVVIRSRNSLEKRLQPESRLRRFLGPVLGVVSGLFIMFFGVLIVTSVL